MDMFKAAIGQPEVIQPMGQRLASNGDAKIGHVGEIGQTHATGLLNLAENDLPLGPVQGPPVADTTFEGPPDALAKFRVAAQNFREDGHRSQTRCRFQHRHDLCVKDPRQGIGPPPVTWCPLE